MRRRTFAVLLVLVWVLLWDQFTIGHVVLGGVVTAALLAVLRPPEGGGQIRVPIRPLAIARLGLWFAHQVVLSNVQVAKATLFPRRYVRPGVIRVPLRTGSPQLAALIANLTALSPGMQPIGNTDEPPSLDVHVLTLVSDADAQAIVTRLEDLVVAAFGTEEDLSP